MPGIYQNGRNRSKSTQSFLLFTNYVVALSAGRRMAAPQSHGTKLIPNPPAARRKRSHATRLADSRMGNQNGRPDHAGHLDTGAPRRNRPDLGMDRPAVRTGRTARRQRTRIPDRRTVEQLRRGGRHRHARLRLPERSHPGGHGIGLPLPDHRIGHPAQNGSLRIEDDPAADRHGFHRRGPDEPDSAQTHDGQVVSAPRPEYLPKPGQKRDCCG